MVGSKAVDASERQDFEDALTRHGLVIEDFDLQAAEDPLPPTGLSVIRGTVKVTKKSTGAIRQYRCGHGTAWVVAFERDLHAGVFS